MNPRDKVFATTSLALDMSLVEDRDGQDGSWVTQDVGEGCSVGVWSNLFALK